MNFATSEKTKDSDRIAVTCTSYTFCEISVVLSAHLGKIGESFSCCQKHCASINIDDSELIIMIFLICLFFVVVFFFVVE